MAGTHVRCLFLPRGEGTFYPGSQPFSRTVVRCLCVTEGVVLLENPKGENKLDMEKLKFVCGSIFGAGNTRLCVFNGKTGKRKKAVGISGERHS